MTPRMRDVLIAFQKSVAEVRDAEAAHARELEDCRKRQVSPLVVMRMVTKTRDAAIQRMNRAAAHVLHQAEIEPTA